MNKEVAIGGYKHAISWDKRFWIDTKDEFLNNNLLGMKHRKPM